MSSALARDVLAATCFVAFVGGAFFATRRTPASARRPPRRISVFLIAVLTLTFAVGLTGHDLYPFTPWNLIAWVAPDSVTAPRLAVVGADGREYRPDFRAWQPLSIDELDSWITASFLRLDPAQQREAAAWLLHRADAVAARARAGRRIGEAGRVLGPLGAPYFILHPDPWDHPDSVPPLPLRALRLYRDSWFVEARARDPEAVQRRLVFEYTEPR